MRLRRMAGAVGAVLAAVVVVLGVAAQPAEADDPAPTLGVAYEIFGAFSPFSPSCVDVPGASTTDGQSLQMFQCKSSSNQLWRFEAREGNGNLTIVGDHAAKCMDVFGTTVVQFHCDSALSQQWQVRFEFFKNGLPVFEIVSQDFQLCLGAISFSNGGHLQLVQCNAANSNDLWSLG